MNRTMTLWESRAEQNIWGFDWSLKSSRVKIYIEKAYKKYDPNSRKKICVIKNYPSKFDKKILYKHIRRKMREEELKYLRDIV